MLEGKAWERPVPSGDANVIPQEAEMRLVVLREEQVRWLTSGMTAWSLDILWSDQLSQQKRKAAAVDQDLSTYYHWLGDIWWWGWGSGGDIRYWGTVCFSSTCPLAMTKQRETGHRTCIASMDLTQTHLHFLRWWL